MTSRLLAAVVCLALAMTVSSSASADPLPDAPQLAEQWSSLASWNDTGVTVSGGRLYGSAASVAGAQHAMPVAGDSRVRASIVLKPKGTTGITVVGVSTSPGGAAPVGSNLIGIGFDATGRPITYQGAAAGGAGVTVLDQATQPEGWYWVTALTDATSLMLTLTNSDGSEEWHTAIKRTAIPGTIGNVEVWNSDTRGTAGSSVGPLGFRLSAKPITVGTGIEGRAPSAFWGWGNRGTAWHVALPANYDPEQPLPLVIYAHGSSGTEVSVLADPGLVGTYTSLLAAGYAVASSSQHGNNWGNQASVDDIVAMYDYINQRYPVGDVFLLGQSMGGASSLQVAASGQLPAAAYAGIYPVTNLQAMWNAGRYRSAIDAAYGTTTYDSTVAAHDPAKIAPESFTGLPMRFYSSPDDTIVAESDNSLAFASSVAPFASEATVVPHVGEHGDPTAFQPYDLVTFFNESRRTS